MTGKHRMTPEDVERDKILAAGQKAMEELARRKGVSEAEIRVQLDRVGAK